VIFLDASVLLAAEDSDSAHHVAAVAALRLGALATLDLAVYEVTNVADRVWKDRAAGDRLRARLWAIAAVGTLLRVDEALSRAAAELVAGHGLSGYDAAYLAGARRLGITLVSCDERDLVAPGHAITPAGALV
jgi:predicted nucleic acid-binding protein